MGWIDVAPEKMARWSLSAELEQARSSMNQTASSQLLTETMSYREALFKVMRDALDQQPAVILGQGVDDHKGTFGTTIGLADEFGSERVIDTPLSEEATTGIAIGAALKPYVPHPTSR